MALIVTGAVDGRLVSMRDAGRDGVVTHRWLYADPRGHRSSYAYRDGDLERATDREGHAQTFESTGTSSVTVTTAEGVAVTDGFAGSGPGQVRRDVAHVELRRRDGRAAGRDGVERRVHHLRARRPAGA